MRKSAAWLTPCMRMLQTVGSEQDPTLLSIVHGCCGNWPPKPTFCQRLDAMADILTDSEATELMAKYGINRIPVDEFRYKSFRYSSLRDAVAQAMRAQAR
jgi:hypothetical protein